MRHASTSDEDSKRDYFDPNRHDSASYLITSTWITRLWRNNPRKSIYQVTLIDTKNLLIYQVYRSIKERPNQQRHANVLANLYITVMKD